jgi:hypothetical protein
VRKALIVAALIGISGLAAPSAQAAPPKLIGCNDRDALIDFETPWAGCTPPDPGA